jgi:hypothetical protein
MEFKRKHDLALDMIVQARRQGTRYNWIGFDGFFMEKTLHFSGKLII